MVGISYTLSTPRRTTNCVLQTVADFPGGLVSALKKYPAILTQHIPALLTGLSRVRCLLARCNALPAAAGVRGYRCSKAELCGQRFLVSRC